MVMKKESNKPVPAGEKHTTKAFVNWSIKDAAMNNVLRSSKGFPLQQHPDYPNKQEDALIALAEKNGGNVKLIMHVSVNINTRDDEIDLDSIPVEEAA